MTGKSENERAGFRFRNLLAPVDQIVVVTTFCTRFPLPNRPATLEQALWAFPIPGALIGVISGAGLWLALVLDLSSFAATAIALALSAILTGVLHEDGFADVADGFWGGHTPERRIEIMRDSRIGAYGVLALILNTLLKVALIAQLADFWGPQPVWMMFIAIHAMSRGGLPTLMALAPKASPTGLAVLAGRPSKRTALIALSLAIGIAYAVLNVTPIWMPLALAAATGLTLVALFTLAKRKIGGITGDVLGAGEQCSEIACWLLLAILIGS